MAKQSAAQPAPPALPGRPNQRHRTRKDLLAAAARLLKDGKTPDMDLVARSDGLARNRVSVFSEYRRPARRSAARWSRPIARRRVRQRPLDRRAGANRARRACADTIRSIATSRSFAACSLPASWRSVDDAKDDGIPLRQNRRTGLIEAALAPARGRFGDATYKKLCAAARARVRDRVDDRVQRCAGARRARGATGEELCASSTVNEALRESR